MIMLYAAHCIITLQQENAQAYRKGALLWLSKPLEATLTLGRVNVSVTTDSGRVIRSMTTVKSKPTPHTSL